MNFDPSGNAWWHWAAAVAIVAIAAVVVVATAGGALAAVGAVMSVANGVAAATTATTIAAGVFIGASAGLTASTLYAVGTSTSLEDFADKGGEALIATIVGGVSGGVDAYYMDKTAKIASKSVTPQVPDKAVDVANYVENHNGTPPNGYKGGKPFSNDGRNGGQILPQNTTYKEYDINPFVKGQNRGSERIVLGSDKSRWYTWNHYKNFIKFK